MSEILGYDVNGRPLRAGDRAILLKASCEPHMKGQTVTILGPTDSPLPCNAGDVAIDVPFPGPLGGWYCSSPGDLRRIDDRTDHQPSEFAFDSLMDHLKQGAPDHA